MGQHRTKQQKQSASAKRVTQTTTAGFTYSIHPNSAIGTSSVQTRPTTSSSKKTPDLAKFIRNDLLKTLFVSVIVAGALTVAWISLR